MVSRIFPSSESFSPDQSNQSLGFLGFSSIRASFARGSGRVTPIQESPVPFSAISYDSAVELSSLSIRADSVGKKYIEASPDAIDSLGNAVLPSFIQKGASLVLEALDLDHLLREDIESALRLCFEFRLNWKEAGVDRLFGFNGIEIDYAVEWDAITLRIGEKLIDFDSLFFQFPADCNLTPSDFHLEHLFIIANKVELVSQARELSQPIYVGTKTELASPFYALSSGLGNPYHVSRSLFFMEDNRTFLLFSKKSSGDFCIGQGTDKVVTKALCLENNNKVFACPGIKFTQMGKNTYESELRWLEYFRDNPYYVNIESKTVYFSSKTGVEKGRLFLEYLQGHDLFDSLMLNKLTDDEKRFLIKELVTVIRDLHREKIVHLDIKPENFFVERAADGSVALRVFDLSTFMFEEDPRRFAGTFRYLAPEYIKAFLLPEEMRASALSEIDLKKVDVYALGLLIAEIEKGSLCRFLTTERKKNRIIQERLSKEDLPEPRKTSRAHMIWQMVKADPGSRITIEEVARVLDLDPIV